ncbi:MAG: phosphate acyltransferase PlsX [Acholeplasmataceae bacterium]|jgi:glycerol-3-phosphate acyltransferase PlsX|nr:phosphate acyltransferase PlsX [Acholeplasmataceae bacterium]
MIKIALDAMGGDFGPSVTVKGALKALEQFSDITIQLFGDQNQIEKYLTGESRITIVHSDSVIDMGEQNPVRAIRNQRDSSMVMAMQSVKDGKNDAVVSAGATQALVVGAHLIIRRMEKMRRVALAPIIPSLDKRGKILLDVGANIELRPEHLLELAIYATVVAELYLKRDKPTVGLINIGVEEGKGREIDKQTFNYLKESKLINFFGNVESQEIFTTKCDILITDGFTGNIVLKTMEGTAKALGEMLKEEIGSSFGGKIGYLFMKKNLGRFAKRLDASEIGGTLIYGLNSPVIKAHGASNELAIFNAIRQARAFVEANIIEKVSEHLNQMPDFSEVGDDNK